MRLSAWAVDPRPGDAASTPPAPTRVGRSHIELEKHLEDWIANDVYVDCGGTDSGWRTRFLMYARPQQRSDGGELFLEVGPKRFAEFFPHIEEEAAAEALRGLEDGKGLSGAELDEGLDQIERFLTNQLLGPRTDDR